MKIKTLCISAIFAATSGIAFAGKYTEAPVTIDMEEMLASGSMTAARFSKNKEELIGCGSRTFTFEDGSTFNWGFCQASLSDEEENAFCFTEDVNLITQINSASDYSYLTFRWNEEGNCTYVGHSTQSFYIPNKKLMKRK